MIDLGYVIKNGSLFARFSDGVFWDHLDKCEVFSDNIEADFYVSAMRDNGVDVSGVSVQPVRVMRTVTLVPEDSCSYEQLSVYNAQGVVNA